MFSPSLLREPSPVCGATDRDKRLLTGDEDFSYTLNKREEEYPPVSSNFQLPIPKI